MCLSPSQSARLIVFGCLFKTQRLNNSLHTTRLAFHKHVSVINLAQMLVSTSHQSERQRVNYSSSCSKKQALNDQWNDEKSSLKTFAFSQTPCLFLLLSFCLLMSYVYYTSVGVFSNLWHADSVSRWTFQICNLFRIETVLLQLGERVIFPETTPVSIIIDFSACFHSFRLLILAFAIYFTLLYLFVT